MRTKEINGYVSFGSVLNYLRLAKENYDYNREYSVKENIEDFIYNIKELNLKVTAKTEAFRDLEDFKKRLDETDLEYKLSDNDASELGEIITRLQDVIHAELVDRTVYVITEKRMDVDKLLNKVSQLFTPDTFLELPDIPSFDFNEAGKCIVFERATAAGYHILRAMEGIIRWFYDTLNNSTGCTMEWHRIILGLRSLTPEPPPEILDHLDSIRKYFRNPTAHPELRFDIETVQDLFSECIPMVNRIIKFLKDKNKI